MVMYQGGKLFSLFFCFVRKKKVHFTFEIVLKCTELSVMQSRLIYFCNVSPNYFGIGNAGYTR